MWTEAPHLAGLTMGKHGALGILDFTSPLLASLCRIHSKVNNPETICGIVGIETMPLFPFPLIEAMRLGS
jgi:hypothetical protein